MKKVKKMLALVLSASLSLGVYSMPVAAEAMGSGSKTDAILKKTSVEKEFDGSFFSVTGFASSGVHDRSQYKEGDQEYRVVNNEKEFLEAIRDAKSGVVKVIELRADLNMGWWELSSEAKNVGNGTISAYSGISVAKDTPLSNPSLIESGLSDLRINNINGLTIFSQSGNTIRHAQFQLEGSVNDFVVRNIRIDEVWEWDDFTREGFGSTGGKGNHKRVGWTPVKINGSKNVWFDHCTFGLGFDGCVDLENGAEGISLTWCKVGDTDVTVGSMIYKTAMYMEQLYQESIEKNNPKTAFTAYSVMRNNGMSVEDIMTVMAYHSKVHLCGAGDKDTWLIPEMDSETRDYVFDYSDGMTYTKEALGYNKDTQAVDYSNLTNDLASWLKARNLTDGSPYGTIKTSVNYGKTDANELLELTLAYNQYWNVGQRVPMIRGGVGHLYNCYINDSGSQKTDELLGKRNESGETIATQIRNAGSGIYSKLQRTMNARNGASIAADTCVWQNVKQPVPGAQYQKNDISNMNSPYHAFFGYNYTSIVNSKVQLDNSKETYIGNSTDKDGNNDFMNAYTWRDPSVAFSWHNLAIKNAYRTANVTDEAVALANYDKLPYNYQTFPLDTVEEVTNKYTGFNKIKMSPENWLKITYPADFSDFVEITEENKPEATGVSLNKSSAEIYMAEGEHLQLTASILPANSKQKASDLVWKSSDEEVATVSNCGLVTPHKYGKTTISVTLGNFTASCEVEVSYSPESINITNIPETVYTGDIFTLSATVEPLGVKNQEVTWNTNSSSINCIDTATGTFQAVKAGTRNITVGATSKFIANRVGYQPISGKSSNITITDPAVPVTGVAITGDDMSQGLTPGSVVQLSGNTIPANATNNKIIWSSSDENVATVDETGKVTAISTGSAIITATTVNYGYTATREAVVIEETKTPDDPTGPAVDILYGDVDDNGKVDLNDATIVLKLAVGIDPGKAISEQGKIKADYDANGNTDLNDATYVLKKAVGIDFLEPERPKA